MRKIKALLIDIPLKSAAQWWNDDALTQAAALAFYTMFSLAPLILITLAVASAVVGEEAARGQLKNQFSLLIGQDGAHLMEETLRNAVHEKKTSGIATLLGAITLAVGSTGAFAQLQSSLNLIWGVKPKPTSTRRTLWHLIRIRMLSFGLVLAVGFLLLASLVVSAVLSALDNYVNTSLPAVAAAWWYLNFALSLSLIAFMFALVFKFLPDVKISWSDVAIGSVVTSLLFGIGKFLIGMYIGNSALASTYGAAGSLVVVLVWVWFSGGILYYGAEYTQVYARNFGSQIRPTSIATLVDAERAEPDAEVEEAMQE